MSRIHLYSSLEDVAMAMCEGNPGALNVTLQLLLDGSPDKLHVLLMCDTLQLYGSKLYLFAHDCCGDDFQTMKRVISAWQQGKITADEIRAHVDGGSGIPFELEQEEGADA